MPRPTDEELNKVYRETEWGRFWKVRARLIDNPDVVAAYPDREERERFLEQSFDTMLDNEIAEIRSRPGPSPDKLLTELYLRHAPHVSANDNKREFIPPTPKKPKERER